MHDPAVLNGGQQFGWCVSKVIGFAGLWVGDDFFVPRFEEPATVSGELFIQPRHRLTEINRFVDHFWVSDRPLLPSIIDTATSLDAQMAYSGEVVACIM